MAKKTASGGSAAKSAAAEVGGSEARRDLDAVSEQFEVLRRDVAGLVEMLGDLAGSTARGGRKTVERTADEYMRMGRQTADEAVSQARALEEELEAKIGRNPLTAVFLALGLGFLIGMMSRR